MLIPKFLRCLRMLCECVGFEWKHPYVLCVAPALVLSHQCLIESMRWCPCWRCCPIVVGSSRTTAFVDLLSLCSMAHSYTESLRSCMLACLHGPMFIVACWNKHKMCLNCGARCTDASMQALQMDPAQQLYPQHSADNYLRIADAITRADSQLHVNGITALHRLEVVCRLVQYPAEILNIIT